MATRPELPYLGAGLVALVGGVRREGGFPDNGLPAVMATVALVLAASATDGTKAAPLVRAVGLLLLMSAIYGTVRAYQSPAKARKVTP